MEPIAQLALGPNQQLRLVRCGESLLLLGVTSQQITMLDRIDTNILHPSPETDSTPRPPRPQSERVHTRRTPDFSTLLQQYARNAVNMQPSES